MSYDTERYGFEKLSGQGLSVIECGLQICHSGHSSGRMVHPDYSATFVLEGTGVYCINGKNYEISSGKGFVIVPDVPVMYTADTAKPWKYIYLSFNGPDSQGLLHNAGLNGDNVIFDFSMEDDTVELLWKMHSSGKNRDAKGYDVLGYFLLVMSRLVNGNALKRESASSDHYINLALNYIDNHFSYGISVEDVADFVGIDRTHLYRVFMEKTGTSPSKHLMEVRLCRAVALMEYDGLSLNEIALSSGFYDLSHFYRAFSAKYGVSPGKYRELFRV